MTTATEKLLSRIRELQDELDAEITRRSKAFRYRLENGRVVFEAEVRRAHRDLRVRLLTFLRYTRPMVVITAPVIYSLIIPFVLLDIFVTLYQWICFPVYGIDRVKRADFIRLDRQHLAYLNGLQKLNCVYCGYGNGVIGYVQEVAGRTEAYWCPIKHASRIGAHHAYYAQFVDYGDAEGFEAGLMASRQKITQAGLSGIKAD
ncbi:hypothetical protein PEL8287_01553 [Roseovarius litorisediminis]|uniref:Uncharacterized protein n=1 Tax=Roseovarius litorisediminis TaxID=1312363 RepID=A0A1Y5S4R0_9RHOB|nr:hypothetical protein [Roseovarius litorisediminis]SLN32565.1 hypothetical protein PEL8287_01553 [Roseovarius litorisediminis]